MTEEKIIDGVKKNKYEEHLGDWYSAKYNTISGINVADCTHFARCVDYGYCQLSNDSVNEFKINCKDNPNCYYKQLIRAKIKIQELENKLQEINK